MSNAGLNRKLKQNSVLGIGKFDKVGRFLQANRGCHAKKSNQRDCFLQNEKKDLLFSPIKKSAIRGAHARNLNLNGNALFILE